MLKVIDYLKKERGNSQAVELLEKEQYKEQGLGSVQTRLKRQYNPNDNNLRLLSLISLYKNHPALINDIKGLLNDVDISYRDKDGDTFLHAAVQEGHQDVVKLILEKGANIDIKNNAGKTPLSLANELDNRNPNKQSIIQMLDSSRQKDDKRKRKQSPFDQDNSSQFAEKTLNQQDYQVWLTQEDVANIARIKYGWHGEDNNVIFEVIGSVEQLGRQLTQQNIDKLTKSNKQSLTFIVNLDNLHWVTLVIIYSNQQFSAYYIDSLASGIQSNIHGKLSEKITGINIQSFSIRQQNDGYNCGIFALGNAKIINDVIESGQIDQIEQKLKGYKPTSDDLENKRKEFAKALTGSKEDSSPKRRKISSPDPQHMEVDQDEHNQEPDYEGHGTDAQSSVGEPTDVDKEDQKSESEGVRSSLHGVVYQMKLSMLFLQAALGSNYSFELYSEKKDADKFDDVVFKYDKPGEMYRFLQAKHKQNPEKKENQITIGKLLSEDSKNPFNLQKYFVSFRRISKKYGYENIGDLTICTNADFSSDIKGEIDKRFTDITKKETDSILGTGKGKRYKIINSNENEDLVKKLKDASDEYKLAKLLIDVILKRIKSLDLRNKLAHTYHVPLVREVLEKIEKEVPNQKGKKFTYHLTFKENFIKGDKDLSPEAKSLQKDLVEKLKNDLSPEAKSLQLDGNSLWEIVKEIEIPVSSTFGERFTLPSEKLTHADKNEIGKLAKSLANYVVNTQEFHSYLEYYDAFVKEGIISDKDDSDFVKGELVSENIKNFRDEFLKQVKEIDRHSTLEDQELLRKLSEKKEMPKISEVLEGHENDAKKLAEELGYLMKSGETIEVKFNTSPFREYKDYFKKRLKGYLLVKDEDHLRFNLQFSENDLPQDLQTFRKGLLDHLGLKNLSSEDVSESLKKYKFKVSPAIFKEFPEEEQLYSKFCLPNDFVKNEEIENFFEKFRFAVKQPDEKELGELVKNKVDISYFNKLDDSLKEVYAELVYDNVQKEMLDWLKKSQSSALTKKDDFFKKGADKVKQVMQYIPTWEYDGYIKRSGISFNQEGIKKDIEDFIKGKRVFNFIYPGQYSVLTQIKVYQVKPQVGWRSEQLLYLNSDLIKALFKDNLLIVICNIESIINAEKLYETLFNVLEDKSKKIILITKKDSIIYEKFTNKLRKDEYGSKVDYTAFNDLDYNSQQELLKKGKVIFQGEEVSLGTLIDDRSKHLLNGEVLTQVINEKRIKIGSKVPQKSDRGSPAYNIIMPEEIKTERFKNEDIKDDLFVISKIKEEKLINLGITEEKICSFDNCDLNDKNTKQFFLLNSKDRDKNIEDFETVCHNYPDKTIHFIEFKDNKFMWNRYYDPDFYTSRKFYQMEIDAAELCKYAAKVGEKKDIFVVSGIKKEDFEEKYKIDKRVIALSKDVKLDGSQSIIILGGDEEKDFSYLSGDDKLKGFNIHWLENKETKLVWKRSKGKTSKLSEEGLVVRKPDLTHDSLLDIVKDTKSTVIADSSGTGKSTTLTLLSDKKKESLDWVVRVNLRDYSSEIDKLLDKYNLKEVVEFFSAIDKEGLEDTFAKKLFEYRLEKEDNILLLFDGFDEISSRQEGGDTGQSADKQKKITNLLKFLKDKTKARIVVTTRPYEKEKTSLENELSVLSYTFKPIENERNENELNEFLKNFWKRSLKLKYSENEIKESQYEEFAKKLIGRFNEAISDEKSSFTDIPLHLRMLAGVYLKEFEKFCNDRQNDDFKDLNIFDLYKEFVDRKYKIYFSEKAGLSSTGVTNADLAMLREQCEKMHKRLAFKRLFSRSTEPFKLFFSAESEGSSFIENKMPNEEKTRELKRIGITQSRSKDDIDFVHRTFAEYFVSKLIYERLKQKLENPNYSPDSKDKMREFLLNHIFTKKENNVIRSFINSELVDKSANLENFWSGQVNSFEKKEQLLLAVKEGLGNIFSFLLHSKKDKGINEELISVPRKRIAELCDNGEYREANLLSDNALKFLKKELEEDHLEVAIMQRYQGNAYGTLAENTKDDSKKEELFKEKKNYLEKALGIFGEHLKAARGEDPKHQKDCFQQALSTFKGDLKSIKAQTTEDLDENQRKVWIRVLEIEIAKMKRNLANAYGDLAENTKDDSKKEELFKKKKEYLEEALSTFEEYKDKLGIAEAKRNLGNVYGELAELENNKELFKKKKEYLKEALSIFEECKDKLGIAEAKRNLGNVYGKLAEFENTKGEKEKLFKEKKKYLEEALPLLKEHYGLLDSKVTKAQKNLSKAYKKLEYPLHAAVILGDKNEKKLEELIANVGADHQTSDDLVTPLHLAVREGHPSIVKLLLDKGANPDIRDNNEKTPLGLAKEQLNLNSQNSQIYQKIIDILESKFNNQQQKTDPIPQGGEVSSEECLSTSHNRRKREVESECLFTWEDVDEFNEEKGEKRDFSRIEIDSEKFVNYIKDLSEGKRSQLIQLADKVKVTGESQSLINKLTNSQKVMNHLARVGRISGMTMHGMMAKNVLAGFLNGDYQGVAVNVGFIAGGQGFAKVAEAASLKGLKLASEGKLLLGRSLRAASPFLARGTSAFVIYDLVNQIKAFKNGTEEALVGVVGDSIYLGVDAAEIGIEIAEAFEVLEGVSSVTGPIGATIGAVVFVGTDVYMAVKRVDKIDEIIHLTGREKFIEGLRAFIGMRPEQYVQELMEEKQLNNQLVKQGLEYLKQHSDVQKYVFPTKKTVCHEVINNKTVCVIPGTYDGICVKHAIKTFYTEKCTPVIEMDSRVILDRKRTDIKWSRARPDNPNEGQLFCLPQGNYERVPSNGSYLCENAIGLSTTKTGSHTLISLGEGEDYAEGFVDGPNIFVVNNGSKIYHGGDKDDIFILQGNLIKGYLYGGGGIDTLDLTEFAQNAVSVEVYLNTNIGDIIYGRPVLRMGGMERVLGRKAKSERIFSTCDTQFLDGQGGAENNSDIIVISNNNCTYKMQIIVRPNTNINNHGYNGDFSYTVLPGKGEAKINLSSLLSGTPAGRHNFFFNYTISELVGINVQNISQIANYTVKSATFSFLPTVNKSESAFDSEFEERFNVTISDIPANASYVVSNGAEIKMGSKGNLYMLENTNKSVDEIIRDYLVVANRLNKMSFFIQSLLSNETVTIGSGNYEVIHNNPLQKSHLVGNGGENVYVIDSKRFEIPLPEVIIYDLDAESSVDIIDLRNLVQQARGEFSNSFKLQVLKSANDLLLKATVEKSTEDSSISKVRGDGYFTVRLKDGVSWYNKTHVIMDNVPMRISLDNNEWSLKPQPLMFERDKEVIVVTSQDIEENTELITPKRAGNYTFVRDHGSDLIITNAFNTQDDLCTIVLSKFYETPKMETLSIKFADKEIVLKDKQKEINTARDINVVKREHKKQVYSDVFNRSPEVMLSDQPHRHEHSRQHIRNRRMVSSSAKPSSWINDLFDWVKSSIGELLSSNTTSSISQVDGQIDVDGAIMLLDLLVRKVTGQKYISTVDQPISSLEAQGYALNIIEKFEKVLNETATKSGISVTNLNFDPVAVQSAIVGQIINGRFSEISKTLYSSAKEACPEFKQTDKFLAHLRSSLEGEKEVVLLQQKVEKPSKILDQQVSGKVELSKKPDTFLNGTSVVKGISNVLER